MNLKTLISKDELEARIKELADQIAEDYKNQEVVLVCVLRGAAYFAVDLSKLINSSSLLMEFMQVSSYHKEKETTGEIEIVKDLDLDIKGRNVLIVEDIIDSGLTMDCLIKKLKERSPKSIKVCSLLSKPDRRLVDVDIDYLGFEIPNKFVLGYGLDYDEYYRNLPFIAYVEEK